MSESRNSTGAGASRYDAFWADQLTDPAFHALYEEEAARKGLWLQLVEARQAAGLTQAQLAMRLGVSQSQIAKIEKRGYEACTLTTLRRYVTALGDGFALDVSIRRESPHTPAAEPIGTP